LSKPAKQDNSASTNSAMLPTLLRLFFHFCNPDFLTVEFFCVQKIVQTNQDWLRPVLSKGIDGSSFE
jgi:hypothetical protein